MDASTTSPPVEKKRRNRKSHACTACRAKKLFCDKVIPCGQCKLRGKESTCSVNISRALSSECSSMQSDVPANLHNWALEWGIDPQTFQPPLTLAPAHWLDTCTERDGDETRGRQHRLDSVDTTAFCSSSPTSDKNTSPLSSPDALTTTDELSLALSLLQERVNQLESRVIVPAPHGRDDGDLFGILSRTLARLADFERRLVELEGQLDRVTALLLQRQSDVAPKRFSQKLCRSDQNAGSESGLSSWSSPRLSRPSANALLQGLDCV
ncbi:hypothetical protein FA10DRAFT_282041 [Acaromyces ingoldii]|uniref:Zn(2)-C6 fungal-type domain-containing protein n=1 Tax=Acaromyces ingoldii TaxID=215250 RepID=A0A316YC49_9BASI|nr:hypothetical protein FA10DRAFT_282041 [Acaromyces ingoldii]PWN86801.1 hypothetical protein FA10DRAFT_282041 [Acaromyces ingoldii]